MNLDEIISITSRQGLFKIISKTRYGFIAQSLLDHKKISTSINDQVSNLIDIKIFGISEEKSLNEIFKIIYKYENGLQTQIKHKSSKEDLMNYFSTIYNNYDCERLYSNDVRKIIQWYNLLLDKGVFSSFSLQNDNK